MSAPLALPGNSQKVPLQSAKGKVFIKRECQNHPRRFRKKTLFPPAAAWMRSAGYTGGAPFLESKNIGLTGKSKLKIITGCFRFPPDQ
jgi:hypothetical protein